MIFDSQTNAPCVIQPPPPLDTRCGDAAFALANPNICSGSVLIIKPSVSFLCVGESLQFRVFEYKNGFETELTEGVTFSSSDPSVFAIGTNGGSGTALTAGTAIVYASNGTQVVASIITTLPTLGCCDDRALLSSIVVDNSLSMGQLFGGGYITRLHFARAAATEFARNILTKDSDQAWTANISVTDLLANFSNDSAIVQAAIAGILQTNAKTNLLDVFETAGQGLLDATADIRVLFLVSDGEQTITTVNRQALLDAAGLFKTAGGIIAIIGCRASGAGFDLLERLATSGFFFNTNSSNTVEALRVINFWKGQLCGASCLPDGDVYINQPELDYSFTTASNFNVVAGGAVNLLGPGLMDFLPGNGLYLDLGAGTKATIATIDSFRLTEGKTYSITFKAAGNQQMAIAGQMLKMFLHDVNVASLTDPHVFEYTVAPAFDSTLDTYSFSFTATAAQAVTVRLYFQQLGDDAAPFAGNLLDRVEFTEVDDHVQLLIETWDDENLVYLPPRCGPSAALDELAAPAAPSVSQIPYTASNCNGEQYGYIISWVTLTGETVGSALGNIATTNTANNAILVVLPVPPNRAVSANIFRNKVSASTDYYLLATVSAGELAYIDTETHAAFAFRAPSISPAVDNTTAVVSGLLGLGYADCCYETLDYYATPTGHHSVIFHDDTTYLTSDGPLTGAVDNATGTVSFWVKGEPSLGFYLFDGAAFGGGDWPLLVLVNDVDLQISCFAAGMVGLMEIKAETLTLDDGQWHHVIASWDLTVDDAAHRHLYVDGVSNLVKYQFDNGSINWSATDWIIGPAAGGGGPGQQPKVFEVWFDTSYIDLSDSNNLEKFRSAGGAPVDLGPSGSIPTGTMPLIYLRKQVPDWEQNQGSGGGFTEHGVIGDGGTDVPGEIAGDGFYDVGSVFTDNCPDCDTLPPGAQLPDLPALKDIESAFVPPQVYSSTKKVTVACPTTGINLNPVASAYTLVSNTLEGAQVQLVITLAAVIVPAYYQISEGSNWSPVAWTFEGSNNGITWTVLDTQVEQTLEVGEVRKFLVEGNSTAYKYYRYNISAWTGEAVPTLAAPSYDLVFPPAAFPVSATATGTGSTPTEAYQNAILLATIAANALLNCVPKWTVSKTYNFHCPLPQTGFRIIVRSASRTSLVSEQHAGDMALAAAIAKGNLACVNGET